MKSPLLNIFRTSKVFAVVLGLHLFVLSLLLFHPGCQHTPTTEAPAPMNGSTAMDNATLADPTRPQGDASSTVTPGAPVNDAAAATSTTTSTGTTIQPSVTSDQQTVTPPVAAESTYTVQKGDSLWSIAHKNGVTVNALLDANNLTRNSVLKVGQTLKLPASSAPATSSSSTSATSSTTASSSDATATNGTYVVKAGDSLGKIAKANGISVRALKTANKLHSNTIRVGQKLKVPSPKAAAAMTEKADKAEKSDSATKASTSTDSSSSTSADTTSSDGYIMHKVASGESPAIIAHKYGMKTSELLSLNNITDPRKLHVGQELKVKAQANSAASTTATATTATGATQAGSNAAMSVQALEAATSTNSDSSAPVVEVKSDSNPSQTSATKTAATESK